MRSVQQQAHGCQPRNPGTVRLQSLSHVVGVRTDSARDCRLVDSRHELASLLGFPSFAHLTHVDTMAEASCCITIPSPDVLMLIPALHDRLFELIVCQRPERVTEFLSRINGSVRERATQELLLVKRVSANSFSHFSHAACARLSIQQPIDWRWVYSYLAAQAKEARERRRPAASELACSGSAGKAGSAAAAAAGDGSGDMLAGVGRWDLGFYIGQLKASSSHLTESESLLWTHSLAVFRVGTHRRKR